MIIETPSLICDPAPTIKLFMESDAFVRGIMGPIGSGKSVGMVREVLRRVAMQEPDQFGIRKSRVAIIRQTYPELKSTTIKTWQEWVPDSVCKIKWDSPISAHMNVKSEEDGTTVDMEVYFLALESEKDVKKLLSLELSFAWVNEARELNKSLLDALTGRVGRYPPLKTGGPTWSGIMMDTNPPDDDHFWYRLAEVERPEGWEFFQQPPAIIKVRDKWVGNPNAENVENHKLGYDYWLRQVPGKSDEFIRVYLCGEYGVVVDGRPVYPEFAGRLHISQKPLVPLKGLPLILGFDFGLTPACVVCQASTRGQVTVLREFVSEDMGIHSFVQNVVKPGLAQQFPGYKIEGFGDPAGNQRGQTDEKTCFQTLRSLGFPIRPVGNNNYTARRESVAKLLTTLVDGEPRIILDPSCHMLRQGMAGKYCFERLKVVGDERFKDVPKKNIYSHISEAMQYAALGITGDADKASKPTRKAKTRKPASDFMGY